MIGVPTRGNDNNRSGVYSVIGQRFGRLLVIAPAPRRSTHHDRYWIVRCDCGTEKEVTTGSLKSGTTRSCGCLAAELARERNVIHGYARPGKVSNEFTIWANMIARCGDLKNQNYGARGIKVCDRWQSSFVAFLEDMGPRPGKNYSIERKDNNGDYEPSNVVWATARQQTRNYRRNVTVELAGETVCLKDATDKLGLPYQQIQQRIKRGWSIDKALTTPLIVGAKWR